VLGHILTKEASAHVCQATSADVDDVISIIVEVATWLHSRGIDQWWPTDRFERREPWITRAKRGELFLARTAGTSIATVTVQWEDLPTWKERPGDAGYIHRLAVRRAYSGQGVGRQLLNWAEDLIISRGKSIARLDCWGENMQLRRYYELAGYTLVAETKVYGYETALYEKSLVNQGG
jgi:GNAT superfamily N-acetyltransferase